MMGGLWNFIIAQDQALNCLIKLSDGYGQPDEMLSSRAYRLRKEHPSLIKWIDRMFFWQVDHCQDAFGTEMARLQSPQVFRNVAAAVTSK